MKKYVLSFADSMSHKPEHADRTARKQIGTGLNFDVTYQVWPNRASMARSIRMQERGINRNGWRAVVALRETEGY